MVFDFSHLLGYSIVAFAMASSPGPNMMYLISRSISQGAKAGFISMIGVQTASIIFIIMSAVGVSTLIMNIPFAFDLIKYAGAIYILYLAWQAVHPNAKSIFEVKELQEDSPKTLYLMGFFTNILNPKAMVLFVSILPQFINTKIGHLYFQFFCLGLIQIFASLCMNGIVIFSAGSLARFFKDNPKWIKIQKWVLGAILAFVAFKILTEHAG